MDTPSSNPNHWLLQDPTDFLNRYEQEHSSSHQSLTLYLFFFVRDRVQLLQNQSIANPSTSQPLTTFSETILFPLNKDGQRYNTAAAQHTIQDLVVEMLEGSITFDELRGVQFADFAHDRPVVLSATESDLSIAIVLTLERAPHNQDLNIRGLELKHSFWKPTGLVDRHQMENLRHNASLGFPGGQQVIKAIFMQLFTSVPKESAEDDWIRQLSLHNLSAILAVETKRAKGLQEPRPKHGFVAVNMTAIQQGTFVFLEPKELGGRSETSTIVHEGVRYWVAAYIEGGEVRMRDKSDNSIDRIHAILATGRAIVKWMHPDDETVYDALVQRRIIWHDEEKVWKIPPAEPDECEAGSTEVAPCKPTSDERLVQ